MIIITLLFLSCISLPLTSMQQYNFQNIVQQLLNTHDQTQYNTLNRSILQTYTPDEMIAYMLECNTQQLRLAVASLLSSHTLSQQIVEELYSYCLDQNHQIGVCNVISKYAIQNPDNLQQTLQMLIQRLEQNQQTLQPMLQILQNIFKGNINSNFIKIFNSFINTFYSQILPYINEQIINSSIRIFLRVLHLSVRYYTKIDLNFMNVVQQYVLQNIFSEVTEATQFLMQFLQAPGLISKKQQESNDNIGMQYLFKIIRLFIDEIFVKEKLIPCQYNDLVLINNCAVQHFMMLFNQNMMDYTLIIQIINNYSIPIIQHPSITIFMQFLPFVEKIFTIYQFQYLYMLYKINLNKQLLYTQEYVFDEMFNNCLLKLSYFGEQQQDYKSERMQYWITNVCGLYDYFTNITLQRVSYFLNTSNIVASPMFQQDQNMGAISQLQDYLAIVKQDIINVIKKIANMFPINIFAYICCEVKRQQRIIQEQQQIIKMQDMIYNDYDALMTIYEEAVHTVVKLVTNQEDYLKIRLMNYNQAQDMFNAIEVMCYIEEFNKMDQPVVQYRHVLAVTNVIRYILKLSSQINNDCGQLISILCTDGSVINKAQTSQLYLFYMHQKIISRIISNVTYFLFQLTNYRCAKLNEYQHTQQQKLFISLSQDTLALRRLVSTQIQKIINNPVMRHLMDIDSDLVVQSILQNIPNFTEKEMLLYKLIALQLKMDQEQVKIITQDISTYFQSAVQAIPNFQAFCQYFKLQIDPQTNKMLINQNMLQQQEEFQLYRDFKFKLDETVALFQYIETRDLIINSLSYFLAYFVQFIVQYQVFLPQNYIYHYNMYRISLCENSGLGGQFLQINVDEPQYYISEFNYQLEWLDDVFSKIVGLLINEHKIQNIFNILQNNYMLYNYQKSLYIHLLKQTERLQQRTQESQITIQYLYYILIRQYFSIEHLYLKLNQAEYNHKILLDLRNERLKEGYGSTESNQVIYYTNKEIKNEMIEQINSTIYISTLSSDVEVLCNCLLNNKQKYLVYGDLLIQNNSRMLVDILLISSQNGKVIGMVMNVYRAALQAIFQTQQDYRELWCITGILLIHFRQQRTIYDNILAIISSVAAQLLQYGSTQLEYFLNSVLQFCTEIVSDSNQIAVLGSAMRGAGFDDKIDKKIRDIIDKCLKDYRLI